MRIAVCVKYVPVVAHIGFDAATKTIIREGVPSEINPFDRLGVLCAVALKASPADQVLAISMGPPQAQEGLRHCLALGADRAVLLTDRALAGSDTLATARALALLLDKERPEVIICGRNSTDAETGQALARTLGAALATTRNVVHAGWLPHHIQVGISGRAIAPRVYLAVGVRGAFNHTVGIQKAGVIIALNQNPRAAIFKAADYGIVGAWQTYLLPLVEALKPVVTAPLH